MPRRRRLTPWQRIARAVRLGTGVRLSSNDIRRLAFDHALMERAQLDDLNDDRENLTWAQQHAMEQLRELDSLIIGRGPKYIHHGTAKALERKELVVIHNKNINGLRERVVTLPGDDVFTRL